MNVALPHARRLAALLLVTAMLPAAAARDVCAAESVRPAFDRSVLEASGVVADRLDACRQQLDRLARIFRETRDLRGDARSQAQAVHAFLHRNVLRGTYEPSASDVGVVLDGGPFNCAAASALFVLLAREAGIDARAVSVRGHVWCRVCHRGESFDVETTCRDWFAIFDRYAGLPDDEVSTAMAGHRGRVAGGRVLSQRELLAIFHFNRGVTHLRHSRFDAAAWANLRALWFDPHCRPAMENLLAAVNAYVSTARYARWLEGDTMRFFNGAAAARP